MGTSDDFKLLSYLASDLRRARVLTLGVTGSDSVSKLRLVLDAFSPRFFPVLLYRIAYYFYRMKLTRLSKLISLLNFFAFGIEIATRCPIGRGLFFPHTHGTVIGAWSIGENATIFQGVTLGARELDFSYLESARPILGDNVCIGSGAKILGGLRVGSGARIGANAVVLESVPENGLAVGVPARVLKM